MEWCGELAECGEDVVFGLGERDVGFEHPAFESGGVSGRGEGALGSGRTEGIEPGYGAFEKGARDNLIEEG